MYKFLRIVYANPDDLTDCISADFKLRHHSFIDRWVERVETAESKYKIDEPDRFYGFGTIEQQRDIAITQLLGIINVINDCKELIWRYPKSVDDQDCLNYLHHIFEVYHGLLDKSSTDDLQLRMALGRLNILIHRCESIARGAEPRHVVTWYGLPKDKLLDESDYELFTDEWQFGTVMLNYAEIGKTLEDLTLDNDDYIEDSAFQPYQHYSADFNVKFYTTNSDAIKEKRAKIYAYYEKHQRRFGPWSIKFTPGTIPLADLVTPITLDDIKTRQFVKSVKLI